jgi:hypothetical protein
MRSFRDKKTMFLYDAIMECSMTSGAKSHEIFLAVFAQVTPKLNMVNLQFAHSSTILASPIISFQDLATEPNVAITLQFDSREFWQKANHADSFRLLMSSSLTGSGRNSTSRRVESKKTAGFTSSNVAPARKSAQIISMQ